MSRGARLAAGSLVFSALITASGCEPHRLVAVGSPGGVWQPGSECTVSEEGGAACPSGAELGFESPEPAFELLTPRLARNLRVSCRRSHCGTGALVYDATLRWPSGSSGSNERLTDLRYVFPAPVEMLGRTVSMKVAVTPLDTPFNAQLAVISRGVFCRIDDGPILDRRGWNSKGGRVGPENPLFGGSAAQSSVPVTEIRIQVYLATDVRNGSDTDTWSGQIWIDDVDW